MNRATRDLDHYISIEQVSEPPFRLITRLISKPVYVLNPIANVLAILPHAEEREVLDGTPLTGRHVFGGDTYFDERPLLNLDIFQRPENAIFVFGWNNHRGWPRKPLSNH
jgi:hypothetical protein